MKKNAFIFSAGSIIYPIIEILWRGHSHYSMAIAGGLSLMLIDIVCLRKLLKVPAFLKALVGSFIITAVEFITGIIVNIIFKMNVWDYSATPYNILGQICLPFSFIWFLISFPAMWLCKFIGYEANKYGLTENRSARSLSPDLGQ